MSTTTTREQIADLFMLDKQEQLHPELARYRVWLQSGLMIKHPLVFSFMHHDAMNAYVNHQLKMKQEAVQQALDSHEYHTFIWLHERPYRANALREIGNRCTPSQYWSLVGLVWQDCENVWQNKRLWRTLWLAKAPDREWCMDKEDYELYKTLDDPLIVHRGVSLSHAERSMSWTLDLEKAEWFAHRLTTKFQKPRILTTKIAKDQAIAYFTGRSESEVLIDPRALKSLTIHTTWLDSK